METKEPKQTKKTIAISLEAYQKLIKYTQGKETFAQTLDRLLDSLVI